MSVQRLANPRVRAGHRHRDPGPVTNMAPCRREHLNRDRSGTINRRRSGTLEYRRQVTDHATGPLGQSQLDRTVQILGTITKTTGHLKDHYLAYGVFSGTYLPAYRRTAS